MKKINKVLFIIAVLLLISASILPQQLNNLDEIWNYNFSRNIAENKLPYKDFNIIQMPGLFIICSIFLRIANELIVTRILGVILSTLIIYMVFKILEKFNVNTNIAALASLLITYMYLDYFCLDYNFFNLLIVLLLIFIEYKNIDNNKIKVNFLIGILAGSSFLIKQTTGAFIIIACILFKLITIRKLKIKQIIKILTIRCIGICIPIILLAIYLTFNNIWYDFIDYTILGIFTFNNKIGYLNLFYNSNAYIRALSFIVPVYFVFLVVYYIYKRDSKTLLLLLYSMSSFIVVYPIADGIHFLIGAMPAIIGIICLMYNALKKLKDKYIKENANIFLKYMVKSIFYLIISILIIYNGVATINIIKNNMQYTELDHFKYIPISDRLKKQVDNVDEYILKVEQEGKQIYILDATAGIYMIPIGKYNKNYDMFLKGNIGSGGEEKQIEELGKKQNTYILIMKEGYKRNWQTPINVIEYIKNNLNKVDEIEVFDVYYIE